MVHAEQPQELCMAWFMYVPMMVLSMRHAARGVDEFFFVFSLCVCFQERYIVEFCIPPNQKKTSAGSLDHVIRNRIHLSTGTVINNTF